MQHITGTVQRKAQAAFPVIVGTHPRDQRTDFLLLVTGQLPGVHLRLRATMARRAGLHDQRPELLPALFFLSFALLVVTAYADVWAQESGRADIPINDFLVILDEIEECAPIN